MAAIFSDPIVPDPQSPLLNSPTCRATLQIEVTLKDNAKCRIDAMQRYIEQHIRDNYTSLSRGTVIQQFDDYAPVLKHSVKCIHVVDIEGSHSEIVRIENAALEIHAYYLKDQISHIDDQEDGHAEGQASYASVTELPGKSLGNYYQKSSETG
jgi:hypothetical protein